MKKKWWNLGEGVENRPISGPAISGARHSARRHIQSKKHNHKFRQLKQTKTEQELGNVR